MSVFHHNRRSMQMLFVLAAMLIPIRAFAQPALIPADGGDALFGGACSFITGNFHFECIPVYMSYLIRLFFGLAGGFALFQIIQAGYEYALSGLQPIAGGLPDKEAAKKRITNAIIGLVVVILTYLIIDTLVSAIFA